MDVSGVGITGCERLVADAVHVELDRACFYAKEHDESDVAP